MVCPQGKDVVGVGTREDHYRMLRDAGAIAVATVTRAATEKLDLLMELLQKK